MSYSQIILACVLFVSVLGQRSPYAGRLPIGFPVVMPEANAQVDVLGDRLGDEVKVVSQVASVSTSTPKLPLEAQGDSDLVRRLQKLPEDKQPFWLLNWQATDSVRKNPMMYQLRPNSFIDSSSFVRV